MVLLVNLFFGQVVFAMEDPNTIINSVKGVVAHECDNYFDAFGKAHCACSGNIDGVKFDLNFCNPNNRVLYYKSNGMFSDYDEVRSSIVLRSTNSDPTCNMVFSAGLTVKGSSVSCAYKRDQLADGCSCKYAYSYKNMSVIGQEKGRYGKYDLIVDYKDHSKITYINGQSPDPGPATDQLNDFLSHLAPAKGCLLRCEQGAYGCEPKVYMGASLYCDKPVFHTTAKCCCTAVEKSSTSGLTKYTCKKVDGYGDVPVCGTDEKTKTYPIPADGTCDSLSLQGKSAAADKQNPGIGKDKLLSEAATLNQLPNFGTPAALIGQAIKVMLSLMGSIALALYVWSGILWTTAAGSSERIETSKKILVWTTAGVVAILSSYILVQFIFKTLG